MFITDYNAMSMDGKYKEPDQIANVMRFLLSEEADFVCGSVYFIDGGSDAMLRPDDF